MSFLNHPKSHFKINNRWAEPEGFEVEGNRILYEIIDPKTGEIVERRTALARDAIWDRHFHSLHPYDQWFADEIIALVQRACHYFYKPDDEYEPIRGIEGIILTDNEIRERIRRIDSGENTREASRESKDRYPLSELPFDQQRALIEQIEQLKIKSKFRIIGEVVVEQPERVK